jgi:hypothetical protein
LRRCQSAAVVSHVRPSLWCDWFIWDFMSEVVLCSSPACAQTILYSCQNGKALPYPLIYISL